MPQPFEIQSPAFAEPLQPHMLATFPRSMHDPGTKNPVVVIRKRRRVVLPDDNSEQSAQPEVRTARVHTLARPAVSEQPTPLHDAHVLARQEMLAQLARRRSLMHDRRPSAVQIVRPPLPEVVTPPDVSAEPYLEALGLGSLTVAVREWKEMNESFAAVQKLLEEIRAASSFRLP